MSNALRNGTVTRYVTLIDRVTRYVMRYSNARITRYVTLQIFHPVGIEPGTIGDQGQTFDHYAKVPAYKIRTIPRVVRTQ